MNDPHIVSSYDEVLTELKDELVLLGLTSKKLLQISLQAFLGRDPSYADLVIQSASEITVHEKKINQQVIDLLALRQPVADDLAFTIAALKASSELQRIGALATSIAKHQKKIKTDLIKPAHSTIANMGKIVDRMINLSLDGFKTHNAKNMSLVTSMDKDVNMGHDSLFRELLTYMLEDSEKIESCTHLMFVTRHLERAGDHAKNVARYVAQMTEV